MHRQFLGSAEKCNAVLKSPNVDVPAEMFRDNRLSAEINGHGVWLYFGFTFRYRNLEMLLTDQIIRVT